MRASLWALLFLLLLVPVATAQDEPPPSGVFGERVDVEVVNVDVVVTDRDGRRVTDLGRDDFELRIDGKPVAIEYFSAPRALEPAPVVAEPVTSLPATTPGERAARIARDESSNPQRYIIVFVDQSALEIHPSKEIVDEIREFVLPRLDGQTAVLVAAFVETLQILTPMTSDPRVVEGALQELQKLRGRGTLLQNERHAIEAEIRSVMIGIPGDAERRSRFIESQRARLENDIQSYGERQLDRQLRSVRALRQWVAALAAIEGRKSLLLGTNGVTGSPGQFLQELTDTQIRGNSIAGVLRERFSTSEKLMSQGLELLHEFEELLRAAQNARVALYTISPRTPPVAQASAQFGGMGGDSMKPPPRDVALVEAASSLVHMGEATGGGSLYLDDGLSNRLERVVEDEDASYSLGFSTDDRAGGNDHPIEVLVRHPGMTTRHRESYRRRTLEDRVEQALSAAISLRAVANPLELGLELGAPAPLGKREKGAEVPLLVRIPLRGLALVPGQGELRGKLSARVAIEDANGEVRFGTAQPIEVVVAAGDSARVSTHNWAYRAQLRLAPGDNRVAVVVVDELSGVFSTSTGAVVVPKS